MLESHNSPENIASCLFPQFTFLAVPFRSRLSPRLMRVSITFSRFPQNALITNEKGQITLLTTPYHNCFVKYYGVKLESEGWVTWPCVFQISRNHYINRCFHFEPQTESLSSRKTCRPFLRQHAAYFQIKYILTINC